MLDSRVGGTGVGSAMQRGMMCCRATGFEFPSQVVDLAPGRCLSAADQFVARDELDVNGGFAARILRIRIRATGRDEAAERPRPGVDFHVAGHPHRQGRALEEGRRRSPLLHLVTKPL